MWNSNGITFANRSIVGEYPLAIFVNTNNTIYVAHRQKNQILVWNEGSESPTEIISGNFTEPVSLFVTSNGDIYIDDGVENRRVQKWISTTETFDTVMNVNSSCYGLFVDIKDNLYCSMSGLHRVVKRSLNDPVMTSVSVAGAGINGSASNELSCPQGIFVDLNLDLYVADYGNNRVQLFQPEESNGTTVAGRESPYPRITLEGPSGISLDASKYLFIIDRGNHRIVVSGPNGFRCLVGCYGEGSQSNQLLYPVSFSFDRSGNIFVTEQYNDRIQKFIYLEKSCGKLNKMMKWKF
jgi:sugar lactone lactonase YvrE